MGKFIQFWHKYNATIVLIGLLIIFLSYSLFLATNLKREIIPDEPAHFIFSKHFSTTLGIPQDTYETFSWGWYIEQNPFLYYWLNARVINVLRMIKSDITDWQLLVSLRVVNTFYALGSVIVVYLMAMEVIKSKWWQLLPVFMFTNTLMFVFLSGGVNYDNLAVFLSSLGLYFFIRVFTRKNYLNNSLAWIISISSGTLVKYTILPLALAMTLAWVIYFIKNRKILIPIKVIKASTIVLLIILTLLVYTNLSIYGINLIRYHSILPPCREILSDNQCKISPYEQRYQQYGLEKDLSLIDSIKIGYPNPIEYLFKTWIPLMLTRIYGILGHKNYYPDHTIFWFELLLYWMVMLFFKYWRKQSALIYSLIGIMFFYIFSVFYINYNSELTYGFVHFALQGRYIFPVIGVAYLLFTLFSTQVTNRFLQVISISSCLLLFFFSGPLVFILRYKDIFTEWF